MKNIIVFCPKCKQPTNERTSTDNGFCRPCYYIFQAREGLITFKQEELREWLDAALTTERTARQEAEIRVKELEYYIQSRG